MDATEALGTALDIRRGKLRLKDVAASDRGLVATALRLPDSRFGQLARAGERKREFTAQPIKSRGARSA